MTISEDAGTFLCNHVAHYAYTKFPKKSIFIHVPATKICNTAKSDAQAICDLVLLPLFQ